MKSAFLSGFRIQNVAMMTNRYANIASVNPRSPGARSATTRTGFVRMVGSERGDLARVHPGQELLEPLGDAGDLVRRQAELHVAFADAGALRRIERCARLVGLQH